MTRGKDKEIDQAIIEKHNILVKIQRVHGRGTFCLSEASQNGDGRPSTGAVRHGHLGSQQQAARNAATNALLHCRKYSPLPFILCQHLLVTHHCVMMSLSVCTLLVRMLERGAPSSVWISFYTIPECWSVFCSLLEHRKAITPIRTHGKFWCEKQYTRQKWKISKAHAPTIDIVSNTTLLY